jgi:hypothetical protein
MEAAEAVVRSRELLAWVTPLNRDCGRLCGAACCQPDEDGKGGMLLFPGENALYDPLPPGFTLAPDRLTGALLLTCPGMCSRGSRPLACRFFPLIPLLSSPVPDDSARFTLAMDVRARPVCPLSASGMAGLSADFVTGCREAGKILCASQETRVFLAMLKEHLRKYRAFL